MPVKPSDYRLITRMSKNGRVYVAEDDNGNYIVVLDGDLYGTFKFKNDANKAYSHILRGDQLPPQR